MTSLRFGLVAHRLHRQEAAGGLGIWARACEAEVRALGLELHVVGGTLDAMQRQGLFHAHSPLLRLPYGPQGGVVHMVSRIAGGLSPGDGLDGAIFLLDPADPSSTYPETQALRRQCVIHGKPFVSTVRGAIEWMAVEARLARVEPEAGHPNDVLDTADQTLALIAHDALKDRMVDFAARHFDLLSTFKRRVATGTTGGRLNAMAWARGWPSGSTWVDAYQSGPLGGDAQIAELVLQRACQKVIFFEDPHVARQHEADIQLLERAVCSATQDASCFNSPQMAYRWAEALTPV